MTKEKDDMIEFDGVIEEVLPNATFRVRVNEKYLVTAMINGKMRKNKIRVLLGDKVKIEVSIYDLHRGRITYRAK